MDGYKKENGIYKLEEKLWTPKGHVTLILRDGKTGKIKNIVEQENLFTEIGKASIASAFRGNTANNKGIATYCAVGTSVVAPQPNDTMLTAEIARKLISVRSDSGKTAIFQTFFTTSEANGNLREAGLFGDNASATLNSGTLFCKTAINRVKSPSDTLTILWQVTFG